MDTLESLEILEERINLILAKQEALKADNNELLMKLHEEKEKNRKLFKTVEELKEKLSGNEKVKDAIKERVTNLIIKLSGGSDDQVHAASVKDIRSSYQEVRQSPAPSSSSNPANHSQSQQINTNEDSSIQIIENDQQENPGIDFYSDTDQGPIKNEARGKLF